MLSVKRLDDQRVTSLLERLTLIFCLRHGNPANVTCKMFSRPMGHKALLEHLTPMFRQGGGKLANAICNGLDDQRVTSFVGAAYHDILSAAWKPGRCYL